MSFFLRIILIFACLSDFIPFSSFPSFKSGVFISLFVAIPKYKYLIKQRIIVQTIAIISIVQMIGIYLTYTEPISSILTITFLPISVIQIYAIINMLLSLKSPILDILSTKNFLLLILCLIGSFQKYLLAIDRPQFVFYETNYVAYWLPIIFLVSDYIESYKVLSMTKMDNKRKINSINNYLFVTLNLLLLFLSQSITLIIVQTIMMSVYIVLSLTSSLSHLIKKNGLKRNFRPVALALLVTAITVMLVMPYLSNGSLLFDRLTKILGTDINDLNQILISLSGHRYQTFICALNDFTDISFVSKLFGGYIEFSRNQSAWIGSINTYLPGSGIGALLLIYGLFGFLLLNIILITPLLSSFTSEYFPRKVNIANISYYFVILFLTITVLTNGTYASPFYASLVAFNIFKPLYLRRRQYG